METRELHRMRSEHLDDPLVAGCSQQISPSFPIVLVRLKLEPGKDDLSFRWFLFYWWIFKSSFLICLILFIWCLKHKTSRLTAEFTLHICMNPEVNTKNPLKRPYYCLSGLPSYAELSLLQTSGIKVQCNHVLQHLEPPVALKQEIKGGFRRLHICDWSAVSKLQVLSCHRSKTDVYMGCWRHAGLQTA